jgi:hypothetical protein
VRHAHPSTPRAGRRVALPIEVAGAEASGEWVVCGGAIREVTSGVIVCPLQGFAVTIGDCLGCHCLVTHSGERDPMDDCVLPEVS